MNRKILTAGLLALLAAAAHADEPAPHPVWSRLKAYRSYFTLGETTPLRHRFTVWFTARGYARADVGADTPEEIDAFTREDLALSSGAFAIPPGELPPVPPEFGKHEASLRAKVLELFPSAVDIQVRHEGRFRTLRTQELLPFSTGEGAPMRLGSVARLHLAAAEGSRELRAFGPVQFLGGFGRLVPIRDPDVLPDFVDYQLPAELAGTSLAAAWGDTLGESHAAAWRDFSGALLAAADAREGGSYENPIEDILAAQGDRVLPEGLDPEITYEVTTYARTKDFQDQVHDYRELRFRLSEVLDGPAVREGTHPETHLRYRVTLDLAARSLALEVETRDGERLDLSYPVKGALLRDGDAVAVDGGWLTVEPGEDGFDHTLPGNGWFTEFDVYPDSSIRTSLKREGAPGS